jgi:hypothetical protein
MLVPCLTYSVTLKLEVTFPFETLVNFQQTIEHFTLIRSHIVISQNISSTHLTTLNQDIVIVVMFFNSVLYKYYILVKLTIQNHHMQLIEVIT